MGNVGYGRDRRELVHKRAERPGTQHGLQLVYEVVAALDRPPEIMNNCFKRVFDQESLGAPSGSVGIFDGWVHWMRSPGYVEENRRLSE